MPIMTHREFMLALHELLLQATAADFIQEKKKSTGPNSVRSATQSTTFNEKRHVLQEITKWKPTKAGRSRARQRYGCKVCQISRTAEQTRGRSTVFICAQCTEDANGGQLFLCPQERTQWNGQHMSCFEVWHSQWQCGLRLPPAFRCRFIRTFKPSTRSFETSQRDEDESKDLHEDGGEDDEGNDGGDECAKTQGRDSCDDVYRQSEILAYGAGIQGSDGESDGTLILDNMSATTDILEPDDHPRAIVV
ncbi:hypothetical protein H257_18956 [Aphanomyces astaci]|uniref:PiggyBac transposable element-derived protein 4 C-terminal zinc-ribbon domain-containing protein n=1 Tax=Aphanomyces astaci TaxID=112090 RepID=W4F9F5_APHAT|nr:hypothetical protein H257_18956 [Aphanomyces astaci]ETV64110.1 hypothetical protein H257_18956 [Aphanomyces astaci]|eukprot:XP_009846409.1 hypothetical protein H257_18956 [Aphanomyces astaci]